MGNCQAIDSASIIIQHPNGKVENLYSPVSATQIMNMNPGHYVALLLTTTLYSSPLETNVNPLRVTRIKLLRPNDTLLLGHVYRLVTTKEVMKELWAKKQGKKQQQEIKQSSDIEVVRKTEVKIKQVKQRNNNKPVNSAASKSRQWQPSLNSISEAAS